MKVRLDAAASAAERLGAAYAAIADDQVRESEAFEWLEALIADVADIPRPSEVSTSD